MNRLRNTPRRYGAPAVLLHWLMAALLVGLAALGLYMVRLPDVGFDTRKVVLILTHKSFGLLAFFLSMLRLAWRIGNVLPALVEGVPDWQQFVARLVHQCFYGLMFALPMSGWLMSSAAGIPASFFGLFDLPDLIGVSDPLFRALIRVHGWLGYALIALILVHAGAALRHHFLLRDDTLRRMLPGA